MGSLALKIPRLAGKNEAVCEDSAGIFPFSPGLYHQAHNKVLYIMEMTRTHAAVLGVPILGRYPPQHEADEVCFCAVNLLVLSALRVV